MRGVRRGVVVGIAACWLAASVAAGPVDTNRLREAARAGDWKAIEAMGPAVLPELTRLYRESTVAERAQIAQILYNLGWKSEDAKRALMADVHTADQSLRLQVQWALGRVSDDPAVVDVLLDNMRNDPVPLFRDKAGCALAYDQVHLAPAQKLRLFEGLIGALDDPKLQVRQVAIQALAILTHQTKGYAPGGDEPSRSAAVAAWRRWLDGTGATLCGARARPAAPRGSPWRRRRSSPVRRTRARSPGDRSSRATASTTTSRPVPTPSQSGRARATAGAAAATCGSRTPST